MHAYDPRNCEDVLGRIGTPGWEVTVSGTPYNTVSHADPRYNFAPCYWPTRSTLVLDKIERMSGKSWNIVPCRCISIEMNPVPIMFGFEEFCRKHVGGQAGYLCVQTR